MDVRVRSMTSAKLCLSMEPFDEKSSRLRIENLSSHTYSFWSMREMDDMCDISLCSVNSR